MYKSYSYIKPKLTTNDFQALKENRLTENLLKQEIDSVEFEKMGKKTTVCLLTLVNGFEIIGTSACIEHRNYDAQKGEEISFADAINNLYVLEGYYFHKE